MLDLNHAQRPEIVYPCWWDYRLIIEQGRDAAGLVGEILKIFKIKTHALTPSRASRSGRYESYNLSIFVGSEAERLGIFAELRARVKFVI